jgi:hypothetical protein
MHHEARWLPLLAMDDFYLVPQERQMGIGMGKSC